MKSKTALTFRSRLKFCFLIALLPVIPIFARLFYLQTVKHDNLSKTAAKEYTRSISEVGPRGTIFDINGNILAQSIITWDCHIEKKHIKNKGKVIRELSKVLQIPIENLEKKYQRGRNYIVIKKKLNKEAESKGSKNLHGRLKKIDPDSAAEIHPNDTRRVIRALELYYLTGI